MKSRTLIYLVILLILAAVLYGLFKAQPSIDSSIASSCLKNGGKYDASSKTCVLPTPAPIASVPTPKPSSLASSATPKPVAPAPTARYYPIHVINLGKSSYYSSTTVPNLIQVSNPPTDTSITSPITLTGLARGKWYFEATAPVILTDAKGKIIAETTVAAQNNWMTEEFVPFMGILRFPPQPTGSNGVVVFKNDNPSGDPKRDLAVEILVKFK